MKNVADVYPLSPMQELMLLHTLASPEPGALLEQSSWTIVGPLDAGVLRRALQHTVDRHPVLRTIFLWEGLEQPLQVVRQSVELDFGEQDWRALSVDEQGHRLEAFFSEDRQRGCELARHPPFRVTLARLGEGRHELICTSHHALLDGWCMSLLLSELFTTYEALQRGEAPDLPAARGYRDFIGWLQRQDMAAAESYWRELLAGYANPIRLAGDGGEGSGQGSQEGHLGEAATEGLRRRGRELGVTIGALVQAAWGLLLCQRGGREDVVFGTTVSGRPADLEGGETILGPFINILPVRLRLQRGPGLESWLSDFQKQLFSMQRFEFTPLAQLEEWSEISGGPLFESLLIFENYPVQESLETPAEGLKLEGFQSELRTNYPLNLVAVPEGRDLALQVLFDRRRFSAEDARHILRDLKALFGALGDLEVRTLANLTGVLGPSAEVSRQTLEGVRAGAAAGDLEACLRSFPEIADVAVLSGETGGYCAYLVLVPGAREPAIAALLGACSDALGEAHGLREIFWVERIPRTGDGAVDSASLPSSDELYSRLRWSLQEEFAAAQDAFELQLTQIWEEVLDVRPIGLDESFFALGGTSISALRMMNLVSERCGQPLPLSAILENPTVRELGNAVRQKAGARPWSPLVPIRPRGKRPPLFCIHPTGGNVLCYLELARYLPAEQPVFGLQAFGLVNGQEPGSNIEVMAAEYVDAIRNAGHRGPYLLAGLSFGGFIAFEMARQLAAEGEEVGLLALIDTWSPVFQGRLAMDLDPIAELADQARNIAAMAGRKVSFDAESLRGLDLVRQIETLVEAIEGAGAVPVEMGNAGLRRFLRLEQHHLQALSRHRPRIYDGRITLLRSSEPGEFRDLWERHAAAADPARGWGELSSEPVTVYEVPGDHLSMMTEPHIRSLANRLANCLPTS